MKDLLVVMGNSTDELRGTMAQYLKQLRDADIDYCVEPLVFDGSWGTISWMIRKIRKMVADYSDYEFLVLSDAFDVQFFGNKESAIARIPRYHVLLAAEKNCHPPEYFSPQIPDVGPWRFANDGLSCGTPRAYSEWCDALEAHPKYHPNKIDQGFFNELLAESSPIVRIDWQTQMFFCLYGGYPELDFVRGEPHNTMYDTWPLWTHANGGWKTEEMFGKYGRSFA